MEKAVESTSTVSATKVRKEEVGSESDDPPKAAKVMAGVVSGG
jgi:hypothetical protein